MDFTEFDIEFLAQKLAENPQSPLFARLADLYLASEKENEAMQLCEEGTKFFPDYYAGYLVQGKAYLHFKEYSKARIVLERARELSPFNKTIKKLLEEIPDKQDESTRTTDENYFTPQGNSFSSESAETFSTDSFHYNETVSQETPIESSEPLPSLFDLVPEETPQETIQPEEPAQLQEQIFEQPAYQEPVVEIPQFIQPEPETNIEPIVIPNEMQEIISQPISHSQFPTFEEYFEKQQNIPLDGPAISLDEFLITKVSAEPVKKETFSPAPKSQEHIDIAAIEQSVQQYFAAETQQTETPLSADQFSIPQSATDIDMLAEKLQNVERIKPQEHYEPPKPITQQEEQTAYESDMVTPTLAEIYASQGEYGAAIQAYEILQFSQPENSGKYQQRIRELQHKQMEKEGLV